MLQKFRNFGLTLLGGSLALALSGCPAQSAQPPAPSTPSAEATTKSTSSAGAALYAQHCAVCHQKDGRGMTGAYPPLDGSEWISGSAEAPISIVLMGMEGPLSVKGESFNGQMPPLGTTLSDQQVAEILTYVRSSWTNDASAVEESLVAAQRKALQKRTQPWQSEDELRDYLKDKAPEM